MALQENFTNVGHPQPRTRGRAGPWSGPAGDLARVLALVTLTLLAGLAVMWATPDRDPAQTPAGAEATVPDWHGNVAPSGYRDAM